MKKGNDFQSGTSGEFLYFFCNPHIWEYATWRRIWDLIDGNPGFGSHGEITRLGKLLPHTNSTPLLGKNSTTHAAVIDRRDCPWTASVQHSGDPVVAPTKTWLVTRGLDVTETPFAIRTPIFLSWLPGEPIVAHLREVTASLEADSRVCKTVFRLRDSKFLPHLSTESQTTLLRVLHRSLG